MTFPGDIYPEIGLYPDGAGAVIYPGENIYPSPELNAGNLPQPAYIGLDPEIASEESGLGDELIPVAGQVPLDLAAAVQPDGPTLDRLWQLSNYDPFFYRNLVSAAGYIRPAWFASAPPPQIRPYIPPRPVPRYTGMGTDVGSFESDYAGTGEFGAETPQPV